MKVARWVVLITLLTMVVVVTLVMYGVLGYLSKTADKQNSQYQPKPKIIPSATLREFQTHAVLDLPIENNATAIYCGTAQLVWNQLIDDFIRSPIELDGQPLLADKLNARRFTANDVDQNSIFLFSGRASKANLAALKKNLLVRFKNAGPHMPNLSGIPERNFLAFSYLEKHLEFKRPFQRTKGISWKGNREKVALCFGIDSYSPNIPEHSEIGGQVEIFDYRNSDDFIIRLKTKSTRDELVLAKVKPNKTLADTVTDTLTRIRDNQPKPLESHDTLKVPLLDVNVRSNFPDLVGPLLNAGFDGGRIEQITQAILFRLDERGVALVSHGFIDGVDNGDRYLLFDDAFLLYLKEVESDVPYFAIWVDSDEFLKFE